MLTRSILPRSTHRFLGSYLSFLFHSIRFCFLFVICFSCCFFFFLLKSLILASAMGPTVPTLFTLWSVLLKKKKKKAIFVYCVCEKKAFDSIIMIGDSLWLATIPYGMYELISEELILRELILCELISRDDPQYSHSNSLDHFSNSSIGGSYADPLYFASWGITIQ